MTCVVGIVHENGVSIGADGRIVTSDGTIISDTISKVSRYGNLIVGWSGSCTVRTLVEETGTLQQHTGCITRLTSALRRLNVVSGIPAGHEAQLLLAMPKSPRLWRLMLPSLEVIEFTDFAAVGSIVPVALHVLETYRYAVYTPQKKIEEAIAAVAGRHSAVSPHMFSYQEVGA